MSPTMTGLDSLSIFFICIYINTYINSSVPAHSHNMIGFFCVFSRLPGETSCPCGKSNTRLARLNVHTEASSSFIKSPFPASEMCQLDFMCLHSSLCWELGFRAGVCGGFPSHTHEHEQEMKRVCPRVN